MNLILPLMQTENLLGNEMFTPFIMIGLIVVLFYFLILRPQNKKQKQLQNMIASMKTNDKIVTIGGIHGSVAQVKENTVIIKVDDNVKMEFSKSAISSVGEEQTQDIKTSKEKKK